MTDKTKVYYNSACPVCKAGIEAQQCRLGDAADDEIEWLDVHVNPELVKEVGAELEAVRERLYVKRADGSIGVGADAFAAIFAKTPGQQWLGKLLAVPGIRQLSRLLYNGFANLLYRWNRAKRRW